MPQINTRKMSISIQSTTIGSLQKLQNRITPKILQNLKFKIIFSDNIQQTYGEQEELTS